MVLPRRRLGQTNLDVTVLGMGGAGIGRGEVTDAEAIAAGYERFNQRCSYCHGMRGIGAKGPPLTRGYYKKSGGTNINLYSTIASGLTINGRPTQMGAFGATISDDDIWRIIAYMRQEYKDRKSAGSDFKYGVYP